MFDVVAKLFYPLSLLFGLISGSVYPSYIQFDADSLTFDYKTGDSRPLYFLNIKNIGHQKARFDVSSNVDWIFFTREGFDSIKSVQLDVQNSVNFILDIRTDLLNDGRHTGEIIVNAVKTEDQSVFDTKKVSVALNKNFIPTPVPSVSAEPSVSEEPLETMSSPPAIPSVSSLPPTTLVPVKTNIIPKTTVIFQLTPAASPKTAPFKLVTPKPEITPELLVLPEKEGKMQGIFDFFKSIWDSIF